LKSSSASLNEFVGGGRSSEVFRHGPNHVLKLYRSPWEPAAIANEFRASRLAYERGLPVPEPVETVEKDGRAGIVFEAVYGKGLLRTFGHRPFAFLKALDQMARVHNAINLLSGMDLPCQHEILRSEIMGARVSDHIKQAALSALDDLPRHDRLCHGDMHPENVIYSSKGLKVIDWQKATRGNPAGDIARTALLLRYGRVKPGLVGKYLPLGLARAAIAWFYVGRCCRLNGLKRSAIRDWYLPCLVSRLFGQAADNEAEVRAAAERIAGQGGKRGSRQTGSSAK
jgi:thiamine kinase